jgi:diphthine-ammonia ligase
MVSVITEGIKEEELADLERAIAEAISRFHIEGVVTGAVESVYQASRIQRICNHLNVWCINPLWKHDQKTLLEILVEKKFQVVISGIFAYPLDEKWLGKQITPQIIARLVELQRQYGISPSGEGGEIETTVLDAPMFKYKIEISESSVEARDNCGVFLIKQARLVPK